MHRLHNLYQSAVPASIRWVLLLALLLLPEALWGQENGSMTFTTQTGGSFLTVTADSATATLEGTTLIVTGWVKSSGGSSDPTQELTLKFRNFTGAKTYNFNRTDATWENRSSGKGYCDCNSGSGEIVGWNPETSTIGGTFRFSCKTETQNGTTFNTTIDGNFVTFLKEVIVLKVTPSATVTMKPEEKATWTIKATGQASEGPLEGVTIHVRNQLLGQTDEIAGTTNADGELKYTFEAPKDKEAQEYALEFWGVKDRHYDSQRARLKVKYSIGDRIIYYKCGGVPLIEFDAGEGHKFEKDDANPDVWKFDGVVTINRILKVDGHVEIYDVAGSENITMNGRWYIPNVPLPGGSSGDLVFYNGPFTYSPTCEATITSIVANMEKKVAGVTFQMLKLGFEGGIEASGIRVAGKVSFKDVRSSCTPPIDAELLGAEEESISLEADLLVTTAGITDFTVKTKNISIGPNFCLKEILYKYESAADKLTLGGAIVIGRETQPWFSLALEAEFLQSRFNSIKGTTTFPCLPMGATGLCFKGFSGFVKGLASPPLSFELLGIMRPVASDRLFEFDLGGRYTEPGKLAGRGNLRMFNLIEFSPDYPWQAQIIDAALEFDLPGSIASIGGTLNIGHFGDGKWIFTGNAKLSMDVSSGVKFKGTGDGNITLPDGSKEPQLLLKRAGVVLPKQLARGNVRLNGAELAGDLNISGLLPPPLVRALGQWHVILDLNTPSLSFGRGPIPLTSTLRRSDPTGGILPADRNIRGARLSTLPGHKGRASTLAAAAALDTVTITSDIANAFFGVVGDGHTPTTYLIDPTGRRHDGTNADSSIFLSRVDGEPQVFWMVADPTPGNWIFGVDDARPEDSIYSFGIPKERPFEVTATNNAQTISVNWSASSYPGDSVEIFLDTDDEEFDGKSLGTFPAGMASATIPIPENLQECEYHLFGVRTGPSGFTEDYAPGTITLTKNFLQAPTGIIALADHQNGRTIVTWTPSVDANLMGYSIHVREPDGRDSIYATVFRDKIGEAITIENHTAKQLYIVTFDDAGNSGCPSPLVSIGTSGVNTPETGGRRSSALDLSAVPNPHGGRTTISFGVPTGSEVTVTVHSLDGSLVAQLHNGYIGAGEHRIIWQAGDVPPGVYLVRVTAGGEAAAMMTTLVR